MRPREDEIRREMQFHSDQADNFKKNIRSSIPDYDPNAVNQSMDRATKLKRNESAARSKVPQLFGLLKKNGASFLRFAGNFTAIPFSREAKRGRAFPNAPLTYAALIRNFDPLTKLSSIHLDSKKDVNGNTIGGCLVSDDGGMTEHRFFTNNGKIEDYKPQKIEKLDICTNPQCYDCVDCLEHQDALHNALSNIFPEKSDPDGHTRGYHIKNLISTLNSWASHHDSCGNDMSMINGGFSCDDINFKECAEKHQLFAGQLRSIARDIEHAFTQDGVGKHFDPINGDDQEEGY